jgi:hypothetical protein
MQDRKPLDDTTAVRQGETLGVMRWVLAISLGAAALGMGVAWLLA